MQTKTTLKKRRARTVPRFTATCGAGLESLLEKEIQEFGGQDITTMPGAVSWQGTLETGYRACLWSRFGSRILLELARFPAPDPDTLYNEAGKIDWDAHFSPDTSFAVYCTLTDAELSHSKYAALRVKDAIVDQFRTRAGRRPDVDVSAPAIRFNLHVRGKEATLSFDLSGDSLHRRGYRQAAGEAPLKETLAAAIVHLAGWRRDTPPDTVLLDPMCGSGTLLIEAALIYGDSAPGLMRHQFGFMAWSGHRPKLWQRLVDEALEREARGMEKKWPEMIGYDADPAVVSAARQNIVMAGLEDRVQVSQRQLAHLESPASRGLMVTNPPYGERLSQKEAVKYLYRCLGRIFRARFPDWQLGFFTSNPELADMTRLSWQKRFRLYNGPIKCRLLVGGTKTKEPWREEETTWTLHEVDDPGPARDFANRLRKNCRELFPWASRESITCLRIYDGDMPEYNLAVDLYEQWVHVQEYAPPKTIDPKKARTRLNQALQVIRDMLQVPHSRIFIKTRQRQKGRAQYQKKQGPGKLYEVREGSCRFLVNFTDYLDTGLFLDHRTTRRMLGELARGKRFLNLYGYTGSATVHAAMGGALATTTVDISSTYLGRARANMSLNGFGGPQHLFIQSDCLQYLRETRERFGLIFVDPPTFSNSRHRKETFDVQRDHEQLLRLAMRRLSKNGLLVFSTNFRKFQLAQALEDDFRVEEITGETIPRDFQRHKGGLIHRCWQLRHRDADQEKDRIQQSSQ